MSDPQPDTSLPTDAELSVYDAQHIFVVCVSDDDEIQQLRQAITHEGLPEVTHSIGRTRSLSALALVREM